MTRTPRSTESRSTPIDANAPSLLTIPAEIRNAIYDQLFVRDHPIIIAHMSQMGWMIRPPCGVALLSTCRQIYAEATACLYSNRFQFISYYSDFPEIRGFDDWMRDIGRQAQLVRRIRVRISESLYINGRSLDCVDKDMFLPLLQQIWRYSGGALDIAFTTHQTQTSSELASEIAVASEPQVITWLNMLFSVFVKAEIGHFPAFRRFPRLLRHVQIDPWQGKARFWSLDNLESRVEIHPVHHDGTLGVVEIEDGRSAVEKAMATESIQNRILDYLFPRSMRFTLDLTNRTCTPPLPSTLGTNRMIRRITRSRMECAQFMLTTCSDVPTADLRTELDTLKSWLSHNYEDREEDNVWGSGPGIKLLALRFKLHGPHHLEDIRIDARRLLAMVADYKFSLHTRIELECHTQGSHEPTKTTFLPSLPDIYSDISCLEKILSQDLSSDTHEQPVIWMNGRGRLCEVDTHPDNPRAQRWHIKTINASRHIALSLIDRLSPRIEPFLGYEDMYWLASHHKSVTQWAIFVGERPWLIRKAHTITIAMSSNNGAFAEALAGKSVHFSDTLIDIRHVSFNECMEAAVWLYEESFRRLQEKAADEPIYEIRRM